MIMGNKNIATLIAARIKPAGDVDAMKKRNEAAFNERAGEPGEKPSTDEGLLSAAEEMIQAFHAKDAEGLVSALKDFISMNDGDEDESDESGEDEKSEPPSFMR